MNQENGSKKFTIKQEKEGETFFYFIAFYLFKNGNTPHLRIKISDVNFPSRELYEYYDYFYTLEDLYESNPSFFKKYKNLTDCFNALSSFGDYIKRVYLEKQNKIMANLRIQDKKNNELNFTLSREQLENKEIADIFWKIYQSQEKKLREYEERYSNLEKQYNDLNDKVEMNNQTILNHLRKMPLYSVNSQKPSENLYYNNIKNKDNNNSSSNIILQQDWSNADEEKIYFKNDSNNGFPIQDENIDNIKTFPGSRNNPSLDIANNNINPYIPQSDKLESSKNTEVPIKKKIWYKDNDSNIIFKKDPGNFEQKLKPYKSCKKFTAFNNKEGEPIIVYTDEENNINIYNLGLNENEKINCIKNAFEGNVQWCRYYKNMKSQQDLILVTSSDNRVRVWDINKKENIPEVDLGIDSINSACLLSHEKIKNNYIITDIKDNKGIQMWNMDDIDKEHSNIIETYSNVHFIDIYYTEGGSIYIINGNSGCVESHKFYPKDDPKPNLIYKKNNFNQDFINVIIAESDCGDSTKILGCTQVKIVGWDFYKCEEIFCIDNFESGIKYRDFCLWNYNYLLICCKNEIRIVNLYYKDVEITLKTNNSELNNFRNIRKFKHGKEGECFIVSDSEGEKRLSLWFDKCDGKKF